MKMPPVRSCQCCGNTTKFGWTDTNHIFYCDDCSPNTNNTNKPTYIILTPNFDEDRDDYAHGYQAGMSEYLRIWYASNPSPSAEFQMGFDDAQGDRALESNDERA